MEFDPPEEVLWEDTFSWKAMYREMIGGIFLSVAVPMVLAATAPDLQRWTLPAIALVWAAIGLLLLYRKLDVWYTLTNQRLLHHKGILNRRVNRVEAIDIDDLYFEQGLIERLIGVGRITIRSSDASHPRLMLNGIDRVRDVYETIERARRTERMRHGLHVEAV